MYFPNFVYFTTYRSDSKAKMWGNEIYPQIAMEMSRFTLFIDASLTSQKIEQLTKFCEPSKKSALAVHEVRPVEIVLTPPPPQYFHITYRSNAVLLLCFYMYLIQVSVSFLCCVRLLCAYSYISFI